MDMTSCPECGEPAEIVDRHVLESTDGPIEHARVRHPGCLEHQLPDGLGDAIRQGALTLEARGERVIGGLSNLHDSPSFQSRMTSPVIPLQLPV